MKTKAIRYAYPTSETAKVLGYDMGVYYVACAEHPLESSSVVCGAVRLSDCKRMADKLEEPYLIFCGKVQDGTQWGPEVYLHK